MISLDRRQQQVRSQLSGRQYLQMFAINAILCTFIYVFLVFIIDPYGICPEIFRFKGFNSLKIEDPFMDGRLMRLGVLIQQPKTVLLGSSRVVLGYDIARLKNTSLWPAYNAATYNSSLKHRLKSLEYIAQTNKNLENVIIEIFPTDVIHSKKFWLLPATNPDKKAMLKEFMPIFFTLDALKNTIAVVKKNLLSISAPAVPGIDSKSPNKQLGQLPLKMMPYSATQFYKIFPPEAQVNNEWESTIKEIYSVCDQYHLNCKFFISPMNVRVLYGYYRANQWQAIEQLKKTMANYSIQDFLWINQYTAEPNDNGVSHWEDCLHHSKEVGNMILDNIAKAHEGQIKNTNETLVSVVNQKTVNQQLNLLKNQLENWVSNNPDLPLAYNIIHDNLGMEIKTSKVAINNQDTLIQINGKTWKVKPAKDLNKNNKNKKKSARNKVFNPLGGKIIINDYSLKNKTGMIIGMAADLERKIPAEKVAIVCDDEVIAWARPSIYNINGDNLFNAQSQDGFFFNYTIPPKFLRANKSVQIYSLFSDGSALKIQEMNVVK